MKNSISVFLTALVCVIGTASWAQDSADASPPAVTLDQALEEARAAGDDFAIVDQTLGVARSQRALDLAKQGLTLTANGSYSAAEGFGDDKTSAQQSLISRAGSASGGSASPSSTGIAQSAQGGLALSSPLTKLSLSVSHSIPSTQNPTQSTSLGLSGSQVLWDGYPGGQFRGTLEKSELTLKSKESQSRQSYSAALAKVKQAYVTMLAAQRDYDVKKQVLAKQSKLLEQVQAVYALRQASEIDLRTAQINAESASIDAATAEKSLRLANERLAVLMGRPRDARFGVADIPDPELPVATVEEAIQKGLSNRNDLAQYEISSRSATIDAGLAKAQSQPALSLTGGAGVALSWPPLSAQNAQTTMAESLSLGAKVSFPVVDSGAADLQSKTSSAQAALYSLQSAQLKKTIAADIRDYFETAQLLARKAELAKQSADLADTQFELVRTQNQFGTATTQDVLTASLSAATAEVNYGTARNAYILAVLSLETAMGL